MQLVLQNLSIVGQKRGTIRLGTIRHNTTQYNTIQHNTTQVNIPVFWSWQV